MNPRRIHWLVAAITLLLAALDMRAHAAAPEEPLEAIRVTTESLLAALDEQPALRSDPAYLERLAGQHAAPRFDFDALARLTLGKHWRRATQQQKSQFTQAFQRLLVRTYSASLGEYSNQRIEYQLLTRSQDGRQAAVRTRIASPDGTPVLVDYSLYDKAGSWRIYDVRIEGISLVSNYRSSFSELIGQIGLDGLIAQLQAGRPAQP